MESERSEGKARGTAGGAPGGGQAGGAGPERRSASSGAAGGPETGPGAGGERDVGTSKEKLLREQELSTERQREGRGWHHLDPGQSAGTTPLPPTEGAREATEETRGTPSAGRAEQQGQARRGGNEPGR